MARLPRIIVPGQPLHILQRGKSGQQAFFSDEDYERYLKDLAETGRRWRCDIHAYVIMPNHVHLLLTPSDDQGPSRLMQTLGRRYVSHINKLYGRTGNLWEGRFRSAVIDAERYLLICYRYVESNPVRAGLVVYPEAYRWSSYHRNALGVADALVTPHPLYQKLGVDEDERRLAYRRLVADDVDEDAATRIRNATEQGVVLGDRRFRESIAALLRRRVFLYTHGGDRKSKTFEETRR